MAEQDQYGHLGRLADHIYHDEPDFEADDVLVAFMEWAEEQGRPLWPHQEEALMSLMAGEHVILGTPTGSGKSMVALGLHFKAMCLGGGATYYTAPIKALVSEKFFELVDLFGKDYVGMLTGDTSINPKAPIICCTAEILANQALSEGAHADISCVAMDEFHFYGDRDRGWAWQVPLLALPNVQFLLMSATLGDTTAIAESLQERTGRTVTTVDDAVRPVPLEFEYTDTALEATVELALREGDAPIYAVHFSQDAALESAQALANYGVATKEQREAIKQAAKSTSFNTAFGKTLHRLLGCGVGVHHAGMLPRYRLLVEKLAQEGLLPVICGTDTLGVGINVPIHTVLMTSLVKFDGTRMRRLNAREFHQIAGRAGRAGFDTVGRVIVQAPEHEIENAKLKAKCGTDEKKLRKLKLKRPKDGTVTWNKQAFERLCTSQPETLKPHMEVKHSMMLNLIQQGGDARARMLNLIEESAQSADEKAALRTRTDEVLTTLINANIVVKSAGEDGDEYAITDDVQIDFALDEPLSPFLLAALDMLEREDPDYALDVISIAEACIEDPRQLLRAQERRERGKALAEWKAEGIPYEQCMDMLNDVTYPKPLADELREAFSLYVEQVPWAAEHVLRPKAVVREMVETQATFKGYISAYNVSRSEGALLRYLSDAYRVLSRTVPLERRDERLQDIISWLGVVVKTVDSSLVDEWEASGEGTTIAAPKAQDSVVLDRRGLTVLVRNALFARVKLAAARD